MTITNAASGPAASSALEASAPASAASGVSQDVFLQLLVAQLRNQDPLNPTDSSEFMSQMAQFSQLEQTISIRERIDEIAAAVLGVKS
jgi:flagellar basal-body rod modification protein FlgD